MVGIMNEELIKRLSEFSEEEKKILSGRGGKGKNKYAETPYPSVDRKELLTAGKLMQMHRHTRFVHYASQRRNYIEGIFMCRGKMTHWIGGQQIVLRQGDLLFVSPDAKQEILPAGEGDIAVHFVLLPEFFNRIFKQMGEGENLLRTFLIHYLCEEDEGNHYLHFQLEEAVPVLNLLENMIWMFTEKNLGGHTGIQTSMGLMFMLLTSYTDKLDLGEDAFESNLMVCVLRYIEEYYQDGRLNDLCHLLGYNIYWLSRAIKKLTGKTYKELLQIKRLNQAAFLLLSTGTAISDISLAVGYDNTSYFHRLFREYYGLSPKEYRREHGKPSHGRALSDREL